MLTGNYIQLGQPISDAPRTTYQQKAPYERFVKDGNSSSGSQNIHILDSFSPPSALTRPQVDFEEEISHFSFKASSETISLMFVSEIEGSPTAPYRREFEDDLGE